VRSKIVGDGSDLLKIRIWRCSTIGNGYCRVIVTRIRIVNFPLVHLSVDRLNPAFDARRFTARRPQARWASSLSMTSGYCHPASRLQGIGFATLCDPLRPFATLCDPLRPFAAFVFIAFRPNGIASL